MERLTRLYVVAGETSGDHHATALLHALQDGENVWEFRGLGGPEMRQLPDAKIENWIEDAAVVGLWEVLRRYPYFKQRFEKAIRETLDWNPEAVLLVDYPGFNLRFAARLRKDGYRGKILYYISPQVWAWNRGRIPKMAKILDLMLCILPFEPPLYKSSGLHSVFVGHPIIDKLAGLPPMERDARLVALLPGSREREIAKHWPILIAVAKRMKTQHPELRFATAAASPARRELMRRHLAEADASGLIDFHETGAQDLMRRAAAGVVASGTATLEAAVCGLPMALIYRVSALTYLAGRLVIKVPFLGMPNLLAGRQIIPEFIQHEARADSIAQALEALVFDQTKALEMQKNLAAATAALGSPGVALRAAHEVRRALGDS